MRKRLRTLEFLRFKPASPTHNFFTPQPPCALPNQLLVFELESVQFEISGEEGQRFNAAQSPQQAIKQLKKHTVGDNQDFRAFMLFEQKAPKLACPLPYVFERLSSLGIDSMQIISNLNQEHRRLQIPYFVPGQAFQGPEVSLGAQVTGLDRRSPIGKNFRSLDRPGEGGGNHQVEAHPPEVGGRLAGLLNTGLTQRNITPAGIPALRIVLGVSVTNSVQVGCR